MELEDILKLILSISSSIIFVYKRVKKYLIIEKTKNIPTKNDLNIILNNTNKEFIQKFVITDLEESYFYQRTGIATNHTSIPKYNKLKDQLGKNFTWKTIKIMLPHLHFVEDKIEVKLSKLEKIIGFFGIVFGLISIILSISIFSNKNFNFSEIKNWIHICWLIGGIAIGFFSIYSVRSIIMAMSAEKKINEDKNKK